MGSPTIVALSLIVSSGALLGLVLGRFYRVPALAAASVFLLLVASLGCVLAGISVVYTAILTVCGLTALQGAYLIGAAMSYATRRYTAIAEDAALRQRLAQANTAPACPT
jgi:hypothetical protein